MKIKERALQALDPIMPFLSFMGQAFREWSDDKALRLAAALAFYSVFSMAPLLVIGIAVAGLAFGEAAVQGQVVGELEEFVGLEAAKFIEDMLRGVRINETGLGATLISLGTMLFGALAIFAALQDALNMIWRVQADPDKGILYLIKRRLLAFSMVIFFGLLLMGSLLVGSIFAIVEAYFAYLITTPVWVWRLGDSLVWLIFFTAVFGAMYKVLPDVKMAWRDVWVGAAMTSMLFGLGKFAISTYLGRSGVGSVFGAAGTLAVILMWIYYSWVIVLFGAELTQVWARRVGSGIAPGPGAVVRPKYERENAHEEMKGASSSDEISGGVTS
ncbi:YihY/virulence factor BrkB family protein [Lujinxingia vulgaris]|nr:YihY/virulence factor BrkB family protein [Lujinxingia vulgaris]